MVNNTKSESYLEHFRCIVGRFVSVARGKVHIERKVSFFGTEKGDKIVPFFVTGNEQTAIVYAQ